ncbi:MAG: CHAT domain-containing protein [bacterium]|nr:CHAT domain-containing protein [bacterium]
MGDRTVISLHASYQDAALFRLDKGQANGHEAILQPLDCDPPDWSVPQSVRQHGQRLWAQLRQDQAVAAALQNALAAPPGEISPIFFRIAGVSDSELLSWETLCSDAGKFVSLERVSPIGRMADSTRPLSANTAEFSLPLRLVAVLGVREDSGLSEWLALKQTAVRAHDAGLELEMQLFVASEATLATIRGEIDADGLEAWIQADEVPPNLAELERALADARANILHLSCHGRTSAGMTELHIATPLDIATGASGSSIQLTGSDLASMPGLDGVWLVTLSCCKSGQAPANGHSLAHLLVSERGVPAAIGMLEPVNASDASSFAADFYQALFGLLDDGLSGLAFGQSLEIEWAAALHAPRRSLCQRYQGDAENNREWALPLLYVRPDAFVLTLEDASHRMDPETFALMQRKADLVAGQLRVMQVDAPEDMRDALLDLLDGYPPELVPDRNGNFPHASAPELHPPTQPEPATEHRAGVG